MINSTRYRTPGAEATPSSPWLTPCVRPFVVAFSPVARSAERAFFRFRAPRVHLWAASRRPFFGALR